MTESRIPFPAVIACGTNLLYFNAPASAYIISPHLEVIETTDKIIFRPSNVSVDPKVVRLKKGGCNLTVRFLYEVRTIRDGEVYKLYRTPSGALAIKKRQPIIFKEGTWQENMLTTGTT